MLQTRLWMGAILAAVAAGVLVVDQWFAPWFPILFLSLIGLTLVGISELLHLLPMDLRPRVWVCYPAVLLVTVSNWSGPILDSLVNVPSPGIEPWSGILVAFITGVLGAHLAEIVSFKEHGRSAQRIGMTTWVVFYLGLLPSFLVQLRWLDGESWVPTGVQAFALAAFVPKCGDIGAYFTGRLVGRNRMSPVLSPKKTWEGFVGGLAAAVGASLLLQPLGSALGSSPWSAVGFGLLVGLGGIGGDLVESIIKRDSGRKDASAIVPGFGGLLDVVDAVLLAAPLAYGWIILGRFLHGVE